MQKELLNNLAKPFDKKFIKKRQGSFGKTLDYIEGDKVVQRLNDVLDGEWTFELVTRTPSDAIVGDHIVVLGRMTIGGVVREQVGGKAITKKRDTGQPLDLANDFKAATTDCLKKCATLFGVALDLYGTDEKEHDSSDDKSSPAPAPVVDDAKATDLQLQAISRISSAKKKDAITVLATFSKKKKLEELTVSEASELIKALNGSK